MPPLKMKGFAMLVFARGALLALLGLWGVGAQAQTLPPLPGSTPEYRAGLDLSVVPQRLQAMQVACDKGDALACYEVGYIYHKYSNLVPAVQAGTSQAMYARAIRLSRQRCAPDAGVEDGCDGLLRVMVSLSSVYRDDELLDGGRLLAHRCIAGRIGLRDCENVEALLAASPEERESFENWVDGQYMAACIAGDADTCGAAFYRQYKFSKADAPRLTRYLQASVEGCNRGAPLICRMGADLLVSSTLPDTLRMAADLYARACVLAPRKGERDIREEACSAEKRTRAALPKSP
jgi:hypothetical protein